MNLGNISFPDFISQAASQPMLLLTVVLTIAVIFVNGWTDAPNAIATAISTRAISPKKAIIMAAIFDFAGILVMTLINKEVAETIYNMVSFGGDSQKATLALCGAMVAIVIWAVMAWKFGIPTSESHALIAGLTGAAIAFNGGLQGVNGAEWVKVLYGLVLSTVLGFGSGYLIIKFIEALFKKAHRRNTFPFFKNAQVAGAAAMAFMHGAQDGQKFMSIFLLGIALNNGIMGTTTFVIPFWLILLCSVVMAAGTSVGGYRIIKSVGMGMVKLEVHQGFAADLAGAFCLFLSSLFGIPVSTTHTKTTAIMGVGAAKRISNVNWGVVMDMVWTWLLTFPGCGLIGYLMVKLFT
jgi:PiT family inorganic phosphate transporter